MKKNVPDIRFKGFVKKWSEIPLQDITYKFTNKNLKNEYSGVLTNSAELGIIDQKDFFEHEIANKNNISAYYVVEPDDFVYNPRISTTAPVGPINRNKLGYVGVMSPLYYVFRLKNKDVMNFQYLDYFFKSSAWHSFMIENGNSGARSDRFSISDNIFSKMPIPCPSEIDEQRKIGSFFATLDNLINQLEQKLEKQRNIKQALLRKMFADLNSDNSTPLIRFKGFEGEWKHNTLSHYLEVSNEINKNDEFDKKDIYSVSKEYGLVNQIEYQGKSFAGASLSNYGVVRNGDVVYTKSPLKNQPYGIIKTNKNGVGIVSPLYGVYRSTKSVNTDFVQVYFDYDSRLNEYLRPLVNKGAKNTLLISDKDSLEGNVVFPQLKEQEKLISLFTTLDNLISKLEQKIQKLRNIKQALLRKMFVQQ